MFVWWPKINIWCKVGQNRISGLDGKAGYGNKDIHTFSKHHLFEFRVFQNWYTLYTSKETESKTTTQKINNEIL